MQSAVLAELWKEELEQSNPLISIIIFTCLLCIEKNTIQKQIWNDKLESNLSLFVDQLQTEKEYDSSDLMQFLFKYETDILEFCKSLQVTWYSEIEDAILDQEENMKQTILLFNTSAVDALLEQTKPFFPFSIRVIWFISTCRWLSDRLHHIQEESVVEVIDFLVFQYYKYEFEKEEEFIYPVRAILALALNDKSYFVGMEDGLEPLTYCIKLDPYFAAYLENRMITESELGKFVGALKDLRSLQKITSVAPFNLDAGITLYEAGFNHEAYPYLQQNIAKETDGHLLYLANTTAARQYYFEYEEPYLAQKQIQKCFDEDYEFLSDTQILFLIQLNYDDMEHSLHMLGYD